ncbi:DUF4012 domain-containing protein [Microbacterium sp. NPDC089189]|uniref:DUF4012 domain-containing protein n=1 Tax=Microbacterium sp. NPDC089189 TaxID=3154972 RepID=UPI0034159D92
MTNPLLPRPARTAGRVTVWVLVALVLLTVAGAVWLGVRGTLAYGHLRAAESAARDLADTVDDPAALAAAIPAVAEDTAAARALTSDPVWQAAETLPWIGDQLRAVSAVTVALDRVAGDALSPLVAVASDFSVDGLRPVDGRIDLTDFPAMHDAASASAAQVSSAMADLDDIDRSALLPPLADAMTELDTLLGTVETAADAVSRATALMPAMLGAEGPRNYLVVFQNNAEWRSLGGIVGAMAMISTEGGSLSLTQQASTADFDPFGDPVIDIGPELAGLTDQKAARYIQNATQVTSFPVAGQIAQEMWARQFGTRVDGVISLDPVALSYLLRATGPITLPTGDVLSSDNAVSLLLNEVYLRYERPADQDLFFEAAAASVFDALANGAASPGELVGALAGAGEQNRLLIWNADEADQAILDGTNLQGLLPQTDAEQTSFGVYVNDGTGSKMDYYTGLDTGVAWCTDDTGATDATLTVTLRSEAPADAATLPAYITGNGSFGVEPGITETIAYLYLPEGAELLSSRLTANEGGAGFRESTDSGRTVLTWATKLAPGETATAQLRARTPMTDALAVRATPVIPAMSGTVPAPCAEIG